MQIATIALVCFVSAVAVAGAGPTAPRLLSQLAQNAPAVAVGSPGVPKPLAGSPPYPPAPPPNETGPLALPHLGSPSEPVHVPPPQKAATPSGDANTKPPDAQRPRQDASRRTDPPRGRTCFTQSETREKISAHRLADPFRALRSGHIQGDALRARLCRWRQDEFVYEISVLRRDGRIAHVYMNASTGQAVSPSNDADRR